jgi:hypothetical protein
MATYLILIITEFVTIFFIALGYLIKYRKRIDFIRGYDRNRVSDPAGLSRWVGNNLLILGGIGVIIPHRSPPKRTMRTTGTMVFPHAVTGSPNTMP